MTTRNEIVKIAKKYVGCKQGSDRHKELVNKFNSIRPHGEVGNYSCAWCAITYTAIMAMAGLTRKQVPMSYNCGRLIDDAKSLGIWEENDAFIPEPGDGIIYYWNDSGKGDCRSGASHVGTVEKVDRQKKVSTVIEGNKGKTHACGRREIAFNGRYIRGFIVPKLSAESTNEPTTAQKPPQTPSNASFEVGKTYTVATKTDPLNIRKDAGKNMGILGTVPKGKKVTCLEVRNGWVKIKYNGITGFVSGDYLK